MTRSADKDTTVTWSQVKNWMPVLSAITGALLAYTSIMVKLSHVENTADALHERQDRYLVITDDNSKVINNHETRITVLEAKRASQTLDLRFLADQTSDASAEPTPFPSPAAQSSAVLNILPSPLINLLKGS